MDSRRGRWRPARRVGRGWGGRSSTGVLGLHRVYAVVDQENAPSAAVLERIGLRREGSFVENAWFKGRWSSEYLYATFRKEWLAREDRPG